MKTKVAKYEIEAPKLVFFLALFKSNKSHIES